MNSTRAALGSYRPFRSRTPWGVRFNGLFRSGPRGGARFNRLLRSGTPWGVRFNRLFRSGTPWGVMAAVLLSATLAAAEEAWETVTTSPYLIKARPKAGTSIREIWAEGEIDAPVQ